MPTTLGILLAPALAAGEIEPPAAPASTPGPEPRIAVNATNTPGDVNSVFRLPVPGSYFLEANVIGVSAEHGIEIDADDVTLDLNGFQVIGVEGSLSGITTSGGQDNLTLMNGTVRGWGGDGIEFDVVDACRIESIIARDNTGDGILTSLSAIVRGCVARDNGGRGISTGTISLVTDCNVSSNDGDGIFTSTGSIIDRCVATANGDDGIVTARQCTVTNSQSNSNTGDGIQVLSASIVRDNACAFNGTSGDAAGIHTLEDNNRIEGNSVINNFDRGIDVDLSGNLIIRNSASNNGAFAAGNYAISGTNSVGPIVTGADPIATTNPWANFEF